ncbi:MAG: hypothetical protein KDI28_04770 [Pseudomonadales bacterium]|nr:hypothetical protein [Pseudomonadales bacterium]
MNKRAPARATRKHLIAQLTAQPMLPAYIEAMPSPVFTRLIQYVGKEDAQELLACATDAQVQDLIESDTWQNAAPGQEEKFKPSQFLEWLQIWQDMSPRFLVAKLQALGSDTLALALDRYVVVVDLEEVGVSDHVDTFYPYGVMPRVDENWEQILGLLSDIADEDPEFLEEALAQCCMRRSLLVDKTYIAGNDTLEHSVDGRRDRHRRDQGYITPMDAASFLGDAKRKSLEQLMIEVSYDPLTALHLAAMQRRTVPEMERVEEDNAEPATVPETADMPSDTRELDDLLVQHHIVEEGSVTALLTGGAEQDTLYLRRQMRVLALNNPAALQSRQNEILYLANVLMEGMPVQGGRLSDSLALQGAWALCNLGLETCVFEEAWVSETEILNAFLCEEPGLIKAFRLGLHLISDLPGRVARLLEAELASPQCKRRLRDYPWVQEQATYALTKFALGREVEGDAGDALNALLDSLLFLADNTVCQQLRVIADALPRFPRSLEADAVPGVHVDARWRFIETPADVQRLQHFIQALEGRLIPD